MSRGLNSNALCRFTLKMPTTTTTQEPKHNDTPPKKRGGGAESSSLELSPSFGQQQQGEEQEERISAAEVWERWMSFPGNKLSDLQVMKDNTQFICKKCDVARPMTIASMLRHCATERHIDPIKYVQGMMARSNMVNEKDFIVSKDDETGNVEVDCRICNATIVLRRSQPTWGSIINGHNHTNVHMKAFKKSRKQCQDEDKEEPYGESPKKDEDEEEEEENPKPRRRTAPRRRGSSSGGRRKRTRSRHPVRTPEPEVEAQEEEDQVVTKKPKEVVATKTPKEVVVTKTPKEVVQKPKEEEENSDFKKLFKSVFEEEVRAFAKQQAQRMCQGFLEDK